MLNPTALRSNKRRRNLSVHVRLDEDEAGQIQQYAAQAGLSPAALMRELAKGYKPRSRIDSGHMRELIALRGDLGRAGGLLKKMLADKPKIERKIRLDTIRLLGMLTTTQAQIRSVIGEIEAAQRRRKSI